LSNNFSIANGQKSKPYVFEEGEFADLPLRSRKFTCSCGRPQYIEFKIFDTYYI